VLIGLAAMGLCVYWLKVSWVAVWADAAYRLTASGPPSWLWPVIGSGVAVGIALAAFAMRGRRARVGGTGSELRTDSSIAPVVQDWAARHRASPL